MNPPTIEVERDGLRLVGAAQGQGTPVVLLHSGGLSSRQWRRLAADLAPHHRVVTPDLLGYGASTPWPAGRPFHFSLDVDLVVALLDQLGEPAHLIGHSYGGLIALRAAQARPVRSLGLCEPVVFGVVADDAESQADLGRAEATYHPGPAGEPDEAWLRTFVEYWNGPGAWAALAPPVRDDFLRAGWKLAQEVRSLSTDRTPADAYRGVTAPTLLLGGSRSTLAARRVLATLARALPHAHLRWIEGAGHMAPLTHLAEVNALLQAHLAAATSAPA